ncbi:MAG: glycosyltransferase family 1 protein [Chlamydiota bacterium]
MKATVCIDARMIFSSGIGTYLQNLIPKMEKSFKMTLLIRKSDEKWAREHFSSELITVDVPIYTVKEQLIYPFCIPSCDLFWSPHYNIPLLPILAKKRIVTIHDVCHLAMPHFFPKWKGKMASFLLKGAVKRSDLVLTVSEFSRKEIASYLPVAGDKIHVLPNGAPEKNEEGDFSLKDFGLNQPFILYVGNSKPHKNVDRLLKAFFHLSPCYDLVLVGPEKCFSTVQNHTRIKRLYKVSDEKLYFLYKKAELLVHPSLYEGFGLTPLEAMNFGCPVVASHAASIPEVCGEAAYYVDPYDEKALYQGMKEVLENRELRQKLIKAGYKQEKKFSWDKTAKRLIELFTIETSL